MNFIFNKVPDHDSKNLVDCLNHFTTDLFLTKAQIDSGFAERLKLKDDCVSYIGSDSNVATHK